MLFATFRYRRSESAGTEGYRDRNIRESAPTQLTVFSLCVQLREPESWPQLSCLWASDICYNTRMEYGSSCLWVAFPRRGFSNSCRCILREGGRIFLSCFWRMRNTGDSCFTRFLVSAVLFQCHEHQYSIRGHGRSAAQAPWVMRAVSLTSPTILTPGSTHKASHDASLRKSTGMKYVFRFTRF
jgi:hypothetical protein